MSELKKIKAQEFQTQSIQIQNQINRNVYLIYNLKYKFGCFYITENEIQL